MRLLISLLLIAYLLEVTAVSATSCYIRRVDNRWILETESIRKVVALEDGRFVMKTLVDKRSAAEPQSAAELAPSVAVEEFSFTLNDAPVSSGDKGWKLIDDHESKLSQGEHQLVIELQRGPVIVRKTYVVYPHTSIIREWVDFENGGSEPIRIVEPEFLRSAAYLGSPSALEFHWMTGGECLPGSWDLRTESLSSTPRKFDSYEPFPVAQGTQMCPGADGVNAKILLNDKQVWPESDWAYSKDGASAVAFDFTADVKAGEQLAFMVNMNENFAYDTTAFDPTIAYENGESHQASKEFSDEQGKNGWRYQYLENGKYIDLVYYGEKKQWRKKVDNASGTPFVGESTQHPDTSQDAARVWTAPHDGRVHVTGSMCNTGNYVASSQYHFRPGSGSYAPWYALYNKDTKQGMFIGFDYFGHWKSSFVMGDDGVVEMRLIVGGHKQTLAHGESFSTPKAFIGLYRDDLDNAGNECLDWQYRYLWDYARPGWFPAIRSLGYWYKGTIWGWDAALWLGGNPDYESTFRKVFRNADLMRYIGADVYHRDWGWWDRAGEWNGPDFKTMGEYLRKYDMGQLIYAFAYNADPASEVAREHPEWMLGIIIDMSKPEAVKWITHKLNSFREKWGPYEWRNDSFFTSPRGDDDTPMLGQDQGFRKVLQGFLDKNRDCAFQAVNGGGNYMGYDYVRYSSCIQMTDGANGLLSNYWNTLLIPPDKMCHMPDMWDPDKYDPPTWRGLLALCFDMTGDTWDTIKLEGVRELIDIYHYLHAKDVVGQWCKVYRPIVDGDDPTMYFQRLSGDRLRGIIITKHPVPGAVTIHPKGLLPDETYTVNFQESQAMVKCLGSDLMSKGIHLESVAPGELIYLNLPLHPGSKLDTCVPTTPGGVAKHAAANMGYPGVELRWHEAKDNNWVSYYEILRNGASIDKVAKGLFYFDHSAGADMAAKYEVCAVDASGNASEKAVAEGHAGEAAMIADDAPGGDVVYEGNWKHELPGYPAHGGTISSAAEKGAAAEYAFNGKAKVLIFGRLGAACGKVAFSLDGAPAEIVDTYSADEIWNVCVWQAEVPAGNHKARIEVLGEKRERAAGTLFYLDGIRIEPVK